MSCQRAPRPQSTRPFDKWSIVVSDLMSCRSSSTIRAVRASFMAKACCGSEVGDPADRLGEMRGTAPVLLDFKIGGQPGDLGAGLGRVRFVGAGLQQERCATATHELAAHREDEVATEHVVTE